MLLTIGLSSCGGGGGGGNTTTSTNNTLTGVVQKGAFQTGSVITVQELTNTATNGANRATGSVTNDLGAYSLTTDFTGWVEVTITGLYYDEFNDQTSETPITLTSIQSLDSGNLAFNVNIFTHFVAARTKQLVQDNADSLETAKAQAETELRTTLSLPQVAVEQLDLHQGTGDASRANSILLLFSGSFMAVGGDATVLNSLLDDFKTDGVFNGTIIKTVLAKASETNLMGRLAANLKKQGVSAPPDADTLGAMPDWEPILNNAPVANTVNSTTAEDNSIAITLAATDSDGDTLSYSKVSEPTHGTVTINGDIATYTPAANYQGSDRFTYKANDGTTDSNTATVNITVSAVNDTPIANDVSASTTEDTTKAITLVGTDSDGDNLSYSIVTNPTHGTVSISGATATYTPTANYHGSDSFTYKVNDGTVDSDAATVSMTISATNDVPVANAVNSTTTEDTAKEIALVASDSDGNSLTYSQVTDATHGTVSINGSVATYTPNANYHGSDSFSYKVNDGTVDSNTATVSIVVSAVNDTPIANAVTANATEDNEATIPLSATDNDGDSLSYSEVSDPSHGTVSISGTTATYTPTENYHGSDSFSYKVNDGTADSNTATVSITVAAVNDAPVANAVSGSTNEDTSTDITLNGTDIDGDALSYSTVTNPGHGTVSISGTTATYTPAENYHGDDRFSYKVNDGTTDSNTVTVNVAISAVNDAPTANAGADQADFEGATFNLSASGTDIEGDTLTYSWQQTDSSGVTIALSDSQSATPSFTASEVSADTPVEFTVTVNDGNGGTAMDTVAVTIKNLAIDDTALLSCFNGSIPSGVTLYQATSFSCSNKDLSAADLSELERLPNLTSLNLGDFSNGNQINDIGALSSLTNLTSLSLGDNQVVDISALANLTNLTSLSLRDNQIIDISALSSLTNLTFLDLTANQIIDISVLSSLTNLTSLDLDSNQIVDISVLSSLTNLTSLTLSNNQIIDVSSLSSLINLTGLSLHTNQITDASSLSSLTNLTFLSLTSNQIVEVSLLASLINLTNLGLGANQIVDISSLSSLENLTSLGLSNNQIIDISSLETLTKLTLLRLGSNQVVDIGSLAGLVNLTFLSLFDNQIVDVSPLENLTNLTFLSLFFNQIVDVASLTNLTNLMDLRLSNNQIIDVNSLAVMTNLTSLNLAANQIVDVSSLVTLINLNSLNLGFNQIVDISTLSSITNIFDLDITANCIIDISSLPTNITVNGADSQRAESECSVNNAPTASAGADQSDWEGATFSLSASGTDMEDDTLTYSWQQTDSSGVMVSLSDSQSATPSFTAPEVSADTTLEFTVTIDDGNGGVATDTVAIVINNLTIDDAALLSCFGESMPSGVELYQTMSLSCENIDLSSANLSELGRLPNLMFLTLFNNQLVDISSLAGLTKLSTLGLRSNQIADISPLASLNNLTGLDLGENQIIDISSLASLINLTFLSLESNQVVDVSSLASLTNLTNLSLFSNQIVNVGSFPSLTNLTSLSLGGNQIVDVSSLASLIKLMSLDLSTNKIVSISPLSSMSNTFDIFVMDNCITDISSLPANITASGGESQKAVSECVAVNDPPVTENNAPIANAVTANATEDNEATIPLSATDSDGDSLSYSKVSDPSHGTVSINGTTAIYTPTANYHGSDSFSYKVNDGTADSNTATVSITVAAVNDAPVANAVSGSTDEDTSTDITLNGTDIDGDALSYNTVTNPEHGTVNISGTTATYTPEANYHGDDSFSYKVNDGTTDSNTVTVNVTVNAVNDAPTANAGTDQADFEGATFNLNASGSDIEGDTLTYSWQQTDSSGVTVSLSDNQSATPSFTASEVSVDTPVEFTVTVNDGNGGTAMDTVAVTIKNLAIDDTALLSCFNGSVPSGVEFYQRTDFSCENIDLSSAKLSELSRLPNLTSLYLDGNQIADVSSLASLTNLINLSLVHNQISDISSLSSLTNLIHLNLNSNQVIDVSSLASLIKLTNLELAGNQIVDVDSLATLANLMSLNLEYNQIVDVGSLATLTNLTLLDLEGNQIVDVNALANLTNLTALLLYGNQIVNISSLSTMTNLTGLSLGLNKIVDVSALASLTNLIDLSLGLNKIVDVSSLTTLTNLTNLSLLSNEIVDVSSLASLTNLRALSLGGNKIVDVSSLATLTRLTFLGLEFNQIVDVSSLATLTRLTFLSLGVNQIADVSPLSSMTNTFDLDILGNCISDVSSLPTNITVNGADSQKAESECLVNNGDQVDWEGATFILRSNSTDIEGDTLTYNWQQTDNSGVTVALSDIQSATPSFTASEVSVDTTLEFTVTIDDGNGGTVTDTVAITIKNLTIDDTALLSCFNGSVPSGVTLYQATRFTCFDKDLSTADLSELERLPNLTSLNLGAFASGNQINDISALSSLTNLTDLDLGGNPTVDISVLSNLTNLTSLNLVDNQIVDISALSSLTNLVTLDLSANSIVDISALSSLTNLTSLDLVSNEIVNISALSSLTNLTFLNLEDNQIVDISALSDLTNLIELFLSSNQIVDISALSSLTNLTDLSLFDHQLVNISALSSLTNLTYLDLNDNQIIDISALSSLTNLTYLSLSSNQIIDISALSSLTNLTGLFLSSNQVVDISALSSLTNLTRLSLRINQIIDISPLSVLTNTFNLSINNNCITDISSLPANITVFGADSQKSSSECPIGEDGE